MSYRDDREALRQQLDELRREVEDLRASSGDDKVVAERVNALTKEVATVLERMDEERDVLQKLATSLKDVKKSLAGDDAAKTPADDEANKKPFVAHVPKTPEGNRYTIPFLAICAGLVALAFIWNGLRGDPTVTPKDDALRGIPGAPNKVDPLAILATAQSRAPASSTLDSIDAWYVSEDGTMDLTAKAYSAHVQYTFKAPSPAPPPVDPSIPLGAPRKTVSEPPLSCVTLDASGIKDCTGTYPGFLSHGDLPTPKCSTRDVWATAKRAGAPSGAVAHLKYGHASLSAKPVWSFSIADSSHSYVMSDPGCEISKDHLPF